MNVRRKSKEADWEVTAALLVGHVGGLLRMAEVLLQVAEWNMRTSAPLLTGVRK